jgi:hypothetical protein
MDFIQQPHTLTYTVTTKKKSADTELNHSISTV